MKSRILKSGIFYGEADIIQEGNPFPVFNTNLPYKQVGSRKDVTIKTNCLLDIHDSSYQITLEDGDPKPLHVKKSIGIDSGFYLFTATI